MYAKGYVLPDANNRWNYLKMAKAMGKNVAVSIYGKAKDGKHSAWLIYAWRVAGRRWASGRLGVVRRAWVRLASRVGRSARPATR